MADNNTGLTAPSGLNHLVLNVRNMDESHAFWTDVVGLKQVGKSAKRALESQVESLGASEHAARRFAFGHLIAIPRTRGAEPYGVLIVDRMLPCSPHTRG